MTRYDAKDVDGKRYTAHRVPDVDVTEPSYRWEADDGSTLPMDEDELDLFVNQRDNMREITDD